MAQVHLIGPPPLPRSPWVRIGGAFAFLVFATASLVLVGALVATEISRSARPPLRAATTNDAASTLGLQEGWLLLKQFCTPGNKYCISIHRHNAKYALNVTTSVQRRGRAQVCVSGSGGVNCREARLKEGADGARQASISWNKEYPTGAHGRRTARYFVDGARVGPVLHFTPR